VLTPKIILYVHKTYADGSHPIILQVVDSGKPIRKVIARCKKSDWLISKNRVSPRHLEGPRINNLIEIALRDFGIEKGLDFFEFFQAEIDKLVQLQQASQHSTFQMVYKQIHEYAPKLAWKTLNEKFILDFSYHLAIKNNKNSIRLKMQVLGKIIKLAKKAKLIKENPMEDLKFGKAKSIKNKLNVSEIQKLISAQLSGKEGASRDIFIASIFLRGTRISDLLCLTEKNLRGDRLVFIENKTGKINNYATNDNLQGIINRNTGKSKHGYIFDFLDIPVELIKDKFKLKKSVTRANSIIRYHLLKITKALKIDKNISMHIARHSFSRLASNTIQDTTVTMGLVGHSSLSIHEAYITEISDDAVMDGYAQQVFDKLK